MEKIGILIVNLGSPRSPTIPAVRDFLREFLSDPFVIDIPAIPRWMLVNLVIAPFRPSKIVARYKTIWTRLGSPLTVHTVNFKQKLEDRLKLISNYEFTVDVGMRYGAPSIAQALAAMTEKNIKKVLIFQLYPHEAFSTSASSIAHIKEISKKLGLDPLFVPAFYNNAGFIDNLVDLVQENIRGKAVDHYIMSYHGIPIRHLIKQSGNPLCGTQGCCDQFKIQNCYKAQCEETSRLLAKRLGLKPEEYTVSFQSRFDNKWLQPFTDHVVRDLPQKGIKNIAIISPSFVTDCLETIEELKVQERDRFLSHGGHMYTYIPCLNDRSSWVNTAFGMISRQLNP